jgi:DMSO/TMAO reductase YedYZ molybdopterin-dependent catalytic subunit
MTEATLHINVVLFWSGGKVLSNQPKRRCLACPSFDADLVKPRANVDSASFECADVYTTSLYLKEIIGENVLFAYRLNGQFLEEGTGAPLLLVAPNKYAYKSAMWLTHIKFTSKKELGYWETMGLQRHSRHLEKRPIHKISFISQVDQNKKREMRTGSSLFLKCESSSLLSNV